jgi:hypothetical protein
MPSTACTMMNRPHHDKIAISTLDTLLPGRRVGQLLHGGTRKATSASRAVLGIQTFAGVECIACLANFLAGAKRKNLYHVRVGDMLGNEG